MDATASFQKGSLANSGYAGFMASNSSSATLAATAFGGIARALA
jgi:hypothetical protein